MQNEAKIVFTLFLNAFTILNTYLLAGRIIAIFREKILYVFSTANKEFSMLTYIWCRALNKIYVVTVWDMNYTEFILHWIHIILSNYLYELIWNTILMKLYFHSCIVTKCVKNTKTILSKY